jgi:uncharacterized membrane protein
MRLVPVAFSVLFVLAGVGAVGCNSGGGGGNSAFTCPSGGTKLTYDGFGKPFMDKYCQPCHASTSKDRQGAPSKINFDSETEIASLAQEAYDQAGGTNSEMPPKSFGSQPTADERKQLAEWLACGAP